MHHFVTDPAFRFRVLENALVERPRDVPVREAGISACWDETLARSIELTETARFGVSFRLARACFGKASCFGLTGK